MEREPGERRYRSRRRGGNGGEGDYTSRRILLGLIVFALLLLLILVVVLVFNAADSGVSDKGEQANEPTPEAASSAAVRVSGTQGLEYSGGYGIVESGLETVDGRLGADPVDYEVVFESETLNFDAISAVFQKDGTDGTLKVEIIVDGEVVESEETAAENGVVAVAYSPEADLFPG